MSQPVCLYRKICITTEAKWFSFKMQLVLCPGKVGEGTTNNPPREIVLREKKTPSKNKTWEIIPCWDTVQVHDWQAKQKLDRTPGKPHRNLDWQQHALLGHYSSTNLSGRHYTWHERMQLTGTDSNMPCWDSTLLAHMNTTSRQEPVIPGRNLDRQQYTLLGH